MSVLGWILIVIVALDVLFFGVLALIFAWEKWRRRHAKR